MKNNEFFDDFGRCPECEGTGEIEVEAYYEETDEFGTEIIDCPHCGGTGMIESFDWEEDQ